MQKFTKEIYRAAPSAKHALTQAIDGLKGVTSLHIAGDDSLDAKINEAGQGMQIALDYWSGIIEAAEKQYKDRPIDLINRASHRLINDIPALIQLEKATIQAALAAREHKAETLAEKGLTLHEINGLCPIVPQSDIDASRARVEALEVESVRIKVFLDDSPLFNADLLIGTSLESSIGTEAAA